MENASRVSNKTEEADRGSTEMAFGTFENDVEALEAVEDGSKALASEWAKIMMSSMKT